MQLHGRDAATNQACLMKQHDTPSSLTTTDGTGDYYHELHELVLLYLTTNYTNYTNFMRRSIRINMVVTYKIRVIRG